MGNKERQTVIVLQNAMAHAVKILEHNSPNTKIKLADVLVVAETIAIRLLELSREIE